MSALSLRLSSFLRPLCPSQPPTDAFHSQLPLSLFHSLLSFTDDATFFVRLPRLSKALRFAFTDAALHSQHGQTRFGLNDMQWRLWSESAHPQLSVPAWQYNDWVEAHECKANEREAKEEEEQRQQQQQQPETTAASQPRATRRKLERGQKDWAEESYHLYQHIHAVTRYMMRHAPQRSVPSGRRLVYHLPRALRALIVDAVCSRRAVDVIEGGVCCSRSQTHNTRLLSFYCWFPDGAASLRRYAWDVGSNMAVLVVQELAIIRRLCPDYQPLVDLSSRAVNGMPLAMPCKGAEWGAEETKALLHDIKRVTSHAMYRYHRPELLSVALSECAVVGDFLCSTCSHVLYALYYGPTLRRVLDVDSEREAQWGELDVWMDDCPIVGTVHHGDEWTVRAIDSARWVEQGGMALALTEDEARRLTDWLELPVQPWPTANSSSSNGGGADEEEAEPERWCMGVDSEQRSEEVTRRVSEAQDEWLLHLRRAAVALFAAGEDTGEGADSSEPSWLSSASVQRVGNHV